MSEQNQTLADVSESVSTPPTENNVAETEINQSPDNSVESPLLDADPWGDFGKAKGEEETTEKEKIEEPTAEPEKVEAESDASLSDEDAILEEIFSDKELDEVGKDEIIQSQPSRRTKKAAERNFELAEIVRGFQNSEKPLTEVLAKFEELNPTRYSELRREAAHALVDSNPEQTFQRAFVKVMQSENPSYDYTKEQLPTLKEFIDFRNGKSETPATDSELTQKLAQATARLNESLDFDWRDPANDGNFIDEELAMVQAVRELETIVKATQETASAEKTAQEKKIEELEQKLGNIENGFTETQNSKLQETLLSTVNEYRDSLQTKLLPLIAKNTGLEITENDTPEIKAFKERRMMLYTGSEYEKANGMPSPFEFYAYHESSVKDEINLITDRIVDAQTKEAQAKLKGDNESAQKFHKLAEAERIPMMEMFARANKEFKAIYVTPDLELISSFGSTLATRQQEAAQRIEVPNTQAGNYVPPQPDYDTADDIWNAMPKEFEKRQSLRAA